jgi:hypothetical protein
LEATNNLVDVGGGVLVKLLVVSKDDDRDVDGTKYGKLMRLLKQTSFALQKGYGSVGRVLVSARTTTSIRLSSVEYSPVAVISNRLDLNLATTHRDERVC